MSGDTEGSFVVGVVLASLLWWLVPNPKVEPKEWNWATKQCEINDGVASVTLNAITRSKVTCRNGAVFKKHYSEMEE